MNIQPIQLFDPQSCTFTYILPSSGGREAVIIDPVDRHRDRDLRQLDRLGLKLVLVLETHAHADHITSAGELAQVTGAKTAAPGGCGITPADMQLDDGDILRFGTDEQVQVIHTPGHTAGSMCFVWRGHVFTGDTLLIDGCGRTDFQGGSADALYDSIKNKLFSLSGDTLVWPGHDYQGRSVSTIQWEKDHNHRLANREKPEFIELMQGLALPMPRLIDVAVTANRKLGLH